MISMLAPYLWVLLSVCNLVSSVILIIDCVVSYRHQSVIESTVGSLKKFHSQVD